MPQVREYVDSTMKLFSLCIPGLHRIMTMHQVREYPDSTHFQDIGRIKMADDHDVK